MGEIERYHCTLNERCRCVLSDMRPVGCNVYQYLHKKIVIQLVHFCIMMVNAVPSAKRISDRCSSRDIVTGQRLNFKHLRVAFGKYIEASVDAKVTNDMKGRTHDCISLGPSENWKSFSSMF